MSIISRDTWRAAELLRQAMENDTVPSALLLEVLKAYTDLKDRTDAAMASTGSTLAIRVSHARGVNAEKQ